MAELAAETKDLGFKLEQVQDFTPTPMTVATVIYYAGVHPYTMEPMETAIEKDDKKDQNVFFFWHKKENQQEIRKQINKMNRPDLMKRLLGDTTNKELDQKQIKKSVPNEKLSWLDERRSKDKRRNKKRVS